MGLVKKLISSGFSLLSAVVLLLSISVYLCPVAKFPEQEVLKLAAQHYNSDTSCPMCGKVAIVTGATNGLGESIALQMFKMGATVIVASRSEEKCYLTVEKFKGIVGDAARGRGRAVAKPLDLSDLQSVKDFAAWFRSNFERLDCLVNNGAINYVTNGAVSTSEAPLRSRQGFDLTFATNYLGHFVLTDRLLPLLKSTAQARIMQISSNSQFMVDGWDLMPLEDGAPLAARVTVNNTAHRDAAYGNSKLAQMLHAKELQFILDKDPNTDLKILSCSPGLTSTGMVPSERKAVKMLVDRVFYSSDAAMYSAFIGLFSADIKGGEYIHNSPSIMMDTWFGRKVFGVGTTDKPSQKAPFALRLIAFVMQAFYQSITYGNVIYSEPHKICSNSEITEKFYQWSMLFTK